MTEHGSVELNRDFSDAFVIDGAKITRIADVIERRFAELALIPAMSFEAVHKGGRKQTGALLQELLGLDNPVRDPIVSVRLSHRAGYSGPKWLATEVRLREAKDFAASSLSVTGSTSVRCNEVFAELSEQMERSASRGVVYSMRRSSIGAFLFFFLSCYLPLRWFVVQPLLAPVEVSALADTLARRATSARSLEEKVAVIFSRDSAELVRQATRPTPSPRPPLWKWLTILVPLLVVLGTGAYVVFWCYPLIAFVWGDYAEEYRAIVDRRRNLWTVVVAAVVIGALGSTLSTGILTLGAGP